MRRRSLVSADAPKRSSGQIPTNRSPCGMMSSRLIAVGGPVRPVRFKVSDTGLPNRNVGTVATLTRAKSCDPGT